MTVDGWLTQIVTVEFCGESFESCTQLINYCQQNGIQYKACVEAKGNGVAYQLEATTTNEAAYTMIRDYKNRGGN